MPTTLKVNLDTICYIGLGSNQGDSPRLLGEALSDIVGISGVRVLAASSLFRTEPQGDPDQPWFFNQVAKISCALAPHELLAALQGVEARLGRVREAGRRFGPRSMDIDILLYGDMCINDAELTVPHLRMRERAFVLVPLAEIAPDLVLPDGAELGAVLENLRFTLTGDKIYQTL